MKRKISLIMVFVVLAMFVGCAGGLQTTKDQSIQFRQQFNLLLAQWNTELMTLPEATRIEWAKKSVPVVQSGVAALELMDLMANTGGQLTPETMQKFMDAKNSMIDLIAKLILSKKSV